MLPGAPLAVARPKGDGDAEAPAPPPKADAEAPPPPPPPNGDAERAATDGAAPPKGEAVVGKALLKGEAVVGAAPPKVGVSAGFALAKGDVPEGAAPKGDADAAVAPKGEADTAALPNGDTTPGASLLEASGAPPKQEGGAEVVLPKGEADASAVAAGVGAEAGAGVASALGACVAELSTGVLPGAAPPEPMYSAMRALLRPMKPACVSLCAGPSFAFCAHRSSSKDVSFKRALAWASPP